MASATAVVSLNGVSSGNGATVDFATAKRNVSAVLVPSATITDGLVVLQASHDGVNWVRMSTFAASRISGVRSFDFSRGAYRYWRGVVSRGIVGGTVVVTFMEAD